MSAFPAFSSAAVGRPFIFSPNSAPRPSAENSAVTTAKKRVATTTAEFLAQVGTLPKLGAVVPASHLDVRPAPEMVSSGIPQLDALTGGLARGCLTEFCGMSSSGRTSVLLSALARATRRGEVCALVDVSDALDPASAVAAGAEMSRLLWVRCRKNYPSCKAKDHAMAYKAGFANIKHSHRTLSSSNLHQSTPSDIPQAAQQQFGFSGWESQLGQMLKVTDLLLQSNGFGMIALDLGDVPLPSAQRIPLASWFRSRRAVENTPTVLLVLEQQPIAGSCSSVLVRVSGSKLSAVRSPFSGSQLPHLELPHVQLLDQFPITAELLRSKLGGQPRPVQSAANFNSRAAWAG